MAMLHKWANGAIRLCGRTSRLSRFLASLKLAVVLMATLAAVLAVATLLEAEHGRVYAQWHVYHSGWFSALLGLLSVNIFCAAAVRFPWKRHQTGFVVTHAGLLVLLAGAIRSLSCGIEGQITLTKGETATHLTLTEQSQITAIWDGRPGDAPYEFLFDDSPIDRPAGTSLDLGQVDGVHARILQSFHHATAVTDWTADPEGGPRVKFRVTGPKGTLVAEHYLADAQSGDALFVGPIRLQLQRAVNDQMRDDFLTADLSNLPSDGLLLAYYRDVAERIRVQENIGRRIPLGTSGAGVKVVEYLPHAQPDRLGRFVTKSPEPRNPLVELRIDLPGEPELLRQIASAKEPLLSLESVFRRDCPVKFRFYHPAVKLPPTVEFMQAADDQLYARVLANGTFEFWGSVASGAKLKLPQGFELALLEYLPHARSQVRFEPAAAVAVNQRGPESAALIEITVNGVARNLWLQRNDSGLGTGTMRFPGGTLLVRYEPGQLPLGYGLKLESFHRNVNPGGVGDAAYASQVCILDEAHQPPIVSEISMNRPLAYGRFKFYQSGFKQNNPGSEVSVLAVAFDPGRTLKYAGSLMICLGIGSMFYMRAYSFRSAPDSFQAPVSVRTVSIEPSSRRAA